MAVKEFLASYASRAVQAGLVGEKIRREGGLCTNWLDLACRPRGARSQLASAFLGKPLPDEIKGWRGKLSRLITEQGMRKVRKSVRVSVMGRRNQDFMGSQLRAWEEARGIG